MDKELLHMLGYITEDQWKDAFCIEDNHLDLKRLGEILKEVDSYYRMNMYEEIVLEGI